MRTAAALTLAVATLNGALVGARRASAAPFQIGDIFAAVGDADLDGISEVRRYSAAGILQETLNLTGASRRSTGMVFDSSRNLYATAFDSNLVIEFDQTGTLLRNFGSGYSNPESIVIDNSGNIYVGSVGLTAPGPVGIKKFDAAGNLLATYIPDTRVDWMDLAADQKTMLYTQESGPVSRVDVSTAPGTSLTPFVTTASRAAYALRILSDGGVLVATGPDVELFDASAHLVRTYDVPGESLKSWFAVNRSPDGTSFWTGNLLTGNLYKFDIACDGVSACTTFTDSIVTGVPDEEPTRALAGVAIFGELTAGGPTTTTTTTTTVPLQACQQLVCDTSGCRSAPAADGTACDNGDACGPDSCKAGACVDNALCGQTSADQQQPPGGRKPVTAVAARCSVEGAIGFCSGQGFVTQALVDQLLHAGKRARLAVVVLHPLEIGDDANVPVTKKARARFDRFGVARFSLKLNPLCRRLLKKATKLGIPLPLVIRFTVMNGGTTAELRRIVQLAQKRS